MDAQTQDAGRSWPVCTASLENMARSQLLSGPDSHTNAIADEALLRTQKIQAIKRPSRRSQRNVHNLIHNTESLVRNEADWIREGTDLAALGCAADRGWLNTCLENTLNTISRTATKVSAQHRLRRVSVQRHPSMVWPRFLCL